MTDPQVQQFELAAHFPALAAQRLNLRIGGFDLRLQVQVDGVVGLAGAPDLAGAAFGRIGTGAHRLVEGGEGALELHDIGVVVGVFLAQQRDLLLQLQQLVLAVGRVVLQAGLDLQRRNLASQALHIGVVVAVDAGQAGQLQLQCLQSVLGFEDGAAVAHHRRGRLGVGQLPLQGRLAFLEEGDLALDALDLGVDALAAHLVRQAQVRRAPLVTRLERRQLLLAV